MLSIKDLARECAVSVTTVSRALNQKPGVSEEVRKAVCQKARELGYRKNTLASGLITSKTNVVGLIVPDITNTHYSAIAQSAATYLARKGYCATLCSTERSPALEKRYLEMLCNQRVDGVIVDSITASPRDLEIMRSCGIKIVALENPLGDDVPWVRNDIYHGARSLYEHAFKKPFSRLVFANSRFKSFSTGERFRACDALLADRGLKDHLVANLEVGLTAIEGYNATAQILSYKPDLIFCVNDPVAHGIMRYCQEHQIKIPGDLRIAGFDDNELNSMLNIPLTTVCQRPEILGRKAADLLLKELNRVNRRKAARIVLPVNMIPRSTC